MAQGMARQERSFTVVTSDTAEQPDPRDLEKVIRNPWPLVGLAVVSLLAAFLWFHFKGTQATPLIFIGLVAMGGALAVRPYSPLLLALAAAISFLSGAAIDPEWDSLIFLTRVLAILAAFGAVVVCLPLVLRKIVVSAFIIFHGLAVISAATSVPPMPWICLMAWSHVFVPYLEATYFTNAYHFYSPQPGPATLLWFYVKYDDGTGQWYKIPNREENPLTIEYQRRLSVTEYAQGGMEPQAVPPPIREERRVQAGQRDGIPVHASLPDSEQFRVPTKWTQLMLSSYARRVAHTLPHPTDAARKPVSVKIYRLYHQFLSAIEAAAGRDPLDKYFYLPFFMGEYDPEGKLIDPNEPYLYWVIPSVDLRSRAEGTDNDEHALKWVERHARQGSRLEAGVLNPDFQPIPQGR